MAERVLLGLDVGGSSIKSALVDVERGQTVTPLQTTPTPVPSTTARPAPPLRRQLIDNSAPKVRLAWRSLRWSSTASRALRPMSIMPGSAAPAAMALAADRPPSGIHQ